MKDLLCYKESRTKDGVRVDIKICIYRTNHTYLSVCGEVYRMIGGHPSIESCGQCTKEMREFFPEYHDFLDLHLSDIDGKPMYAIENGLYFLKNVDKYSLETIMNHFRVDEKEASLLVELSKSDSPMLLTCIASYYPRWMNEMSDAIKRLEQLCGKKLELV